jgi:hypothetical protein
MNGTFTIIMARFRPSGWVIAPDMRQPSGTQIRLMLPATQFRVIQHSALLLEYKYMSLKRSVIINGYNQRSDILVFTCCEGCSITQAVICWFSTKRPVLNHRVSSCGMCSRQIAPGTRLPPNNSASFHHHSTNVPQLSIMTLKECDLFSCGGHIVLHI